MNPSKLARPVSKLAVPKAAAAAAGVGSADSSTPAGEIQELDLSDQFVSPVQPEAAPPSSYMSAAVADEPEVETFEPSQNTPKIAVDPMMAEGGPRGGGGTSFSEISELPPLKEIYVAPPTPPPVEVAPLQAATPAPTMYRASAKKDEKPKIQPREVAGKAIKEIKGVPPKLYMYALGAAGVLILVIGIAVTIYIHNQNGDEDSGAPRSTAVTETQLQVEATQAAPKKEPDPAPVAAQPVEVPEPEVTESQPAANQRSRGANNRKKGQSAVVIPGQLAVDSTPQGAQVQVDGASDPSWVTPFALTNLQPGRHSISVSKAGYISDSRTIEVTSGNRATANIHLAQLMATLVVKSDPPGASIYVDGRDTATKTPGQVSVDKGSHVVLVRMTGYLDETMNGQFALGQSLTFSPTLRQLGNVDSIKTVGGKMSRLFGGKGGQPDQARVSIHTQPKGAEISVNQHMLDKNSPVDVMLDPGNYEIVISLSGYAPVRKVITATRGGKVVIDEALQPQ